MIKNIDIWGRTFQLNVIFDLYENEKITSTQMEALKLFLNSSKELLVSDEIVKQYCMKNDSQNIGEDEITNVFRYVMPRSIFVANAFDKRVVGVLCNYRFDEEHGIAIVFENEEFKCIGQQDIIL